MNIRGINSILLILTFLLTSCIKFDLYNTSHPEQGRLFLTIDWSRRGTGVPIPETCIEEAGGSRAEIKGEVKAYPLPLLVEGECLVKIYNPADKIKVEGDIASVESSNGFTASMPGWFFTFTQTVEVKKDSEYYLSATMEQQVRPINLFIITHAENVPLISSVSGTLEGVAGQFDLLKKTVVGSVCKTAFDFGAFEKIESLLGGLWYSRANIRLIGIFPSEKQKLILRLNFSDGSNILIEKDVSEQFINFNKNKLLPLELSTEVELENTQAGIWAEVSDWKEAGIEIIVD